MPQTRRYLFHGHAAALGGRIVRLGEGRQAELIKDGFIDLPGSALTVVGGRSTAKLDAKQLTGRAADVVRFGSATTFSQGVYDDLKGHFAVTLGERSAETLTSTTKVGAEVVGLEVGLAHGVRLRVRRVRGGFTSQSASTGAETPVQLDPDTAFEDVTLVDKAGKSYTLAVEVESSVFTEHDTYSKLTTAAGSVAFRKRFGHTLFLEAPTGGSKTIVQAPPLKRTDGGAVQGTIVKPLRWKGAEFPGSRIDADARHSVFVPGLGTLFFGELSIARKARRLTMIRATLGSPAGGDVAMCDIQNNGEWS